MFHARNVYSFRRSGRGPAGPENALGSLAARGFINAGEGWFVWRSWLPTAVSDMCGRIGLALVLQCAVWNRNPGHVIFIPI